MGHFSVYCQFSKITITDQDCVFIPIKQSQKDWHFALLPIYGKYNSYAHIENVDETCPAYTQLIKKHYKVSSLEEFSNTLVNYHRGDIENEAILEKFKGLNYCWVDRKVWDYLSSLQFDTRINLGNREILEYLGFTYIKDLDPKRIKDIRFRHLWEKDNFKVYSDGTWLQREGNKSLHYIEEDKYKNGLLDFVSLDNDKIEYLKNKSTFELKDIYSNEKIINSSLFTPFNFDREPIKDYFRESRLENPLWQQRQDYYIECSKEVKLGMRDYYLDLAEKTNDISIDVMEHIIKQDLHLFYKELCKVKKVDMNTYYGNYWLEPYKSCKAPQDGEYAKHQLILDKFSEINKKYIYIDEDE